MTLCGRYVDRFSQASHALPDGMHMNADYPFMLPRIVAYDGVMVTIEGSGGERTSFRARRRRGLGMYGYVNQSSSFERLFGRSPQRFRVRPFKDEQTPSIADQQTALVQGQARGPDGPRASNASEGSEANGGGEE